ncbi:uncharacterized protein EI97DRAFT_432551 [Westerdykella ornata]|uniref:Uncharacterized protein n=1 Tax=Westerdykella ornata TaxID=318751 RepID=A0A6A6JMH1_WESOR|nr:uncharacterized protein EI97DRAFT_432551 [Westerdykella ornata]KAF2277692.1 hypothetical protein EI97DRAFT_432551 [Westerdykella ornata]
MAYYSYDQHDSPRRHDSYGYSSMNPNGYSNFAASYNSYDPRYPSYATAPPVPRQPSTQYSYRPNNRKDRTWPPSPSVEDEKDSLAKEVPSQDVHPEDDIRDVESRGSIDQYPIIQEIKRPDDDRRFVLLSNPSADSPDKDSAKNRRRSFAERGNMHHIKTQVDEPPMFTGRTRTPYAYTKPQKEVLTPSGEYTLSPEPVTPSHASIPRTVPSRDAWDGHRDQGENPSKVELHNSRYDSFAESPRTSKHDVFEDTDTDDDTTYLHAERKPARYSFVKSDLQKDDLRASLSDSQGKSKANPSVQGRTSSGSSTLQTPGTQSPRSSTSSLGGAYPARAKVPPAPIERHDSSKSSYYGSQSSCPSSPRPCSPLHRDAAPSPPRSPNQTPRRTDSPSTSRPSSRSGRHGPPSPFSSSTVHPPPSPRIGDADWRSTYPPANISPRPRASSRVSRHDSLPTRGPRIDVQSASPARPPKPEHPLPYPVDGISLDAFMPPEEEYQFDHSTRARSPNPVYAESQKLPPSPAPNSPRDRFSRKHPHNNERPRRTLSLDRPMPSCPRSEASPKYDDWYTLDSCPNFDICPSCYFGVFADTEFSDYFRPVHRYGERYCDFSSPWMRLAWLLTIKQQRPTPDLLYQLATILDVEAPCPKDREVRDAVWYGLPDPRDGIHVSNFSVCPCDVKMLEALCPTLRGYLTPLPYSQGYNLTQQNYICALRTSSKRFPKYLDLLVEIDEEARNTGRGPDISPFLKLAREHAFQNQCARSKPLHRRPWHFIPSLPEFTVCEECYQDVVCPAFQRKNPIARLFNYTTQLVPGEDSTGTSCCLYSPRMRKVWDRAIEKEDFGYLRRKATDRKEVERRLVGGLMEIEEWKRRAASGVGAHDADRMVERLRRELVRDYEDWEAVE